LSNYSEKMIEVMNEDNLQTNSIAISSKCCNNDKHVIFWDFDCKKDFKTLSKIEKVLNSTSDVFKLDKIFIFESRGGYNAICLNMLPFEDVYNIKNKTMHDDQKHNDFGYDRLFWRWRIGNDKKLISSINHPFKKYTCSYAHMLFLNKQYHTDITSDYTYDDEKMVLIAGYWSWKEACNDKLERNKML